MPPAHSLPPPAPRPVPGAASSRRPGPALCPAAVASPRVPPSPVLTSPVSDAETHLIRLCLDLQVDALLLTLGATVTGTDPGTPPWRRWALEDVQTACALAADVRDGGAALPSTLGLEEDRAVPGVAVDNLVARYESMVTLLTDVLPPGTTPPVPDRPRVRAVLAQCERRLHELRANRTGGASRTGGAGRAAPPVLHLKDPSDVLHLDVTEPAGLAAARFG